MKTIVIKLGGSALDSALVELVKTVSGLRARGARVVLVHGGGPAINKELNRLGITWTFVNGQRRTTQEMIDVIDTVLATQVNSKVVDALKASGLRAVGLSGAAHDILWCTQASADLGLVGQVDDVSTQVIDAALKRGDIPVIAPVGIGRDGQRYNVNADWAATKIAIALKADELLFLTDQNGILDGEKNLVAKASPKDLEAMIAGGVVSGGMCTKVLAMIAALHQGVRQIRVLNALASSGSLGRKRLGTVLTETKETYGYAAGA